MYLLKSFLCNTINSVFLLTTIVAFLSELNNKANSPKQSPTPEIPTYLVSSNPGLLTNTLASPFKIT